jgi:hypothetical protein
MPWDFGNGRSLHFIKHDQGINFKAHHGAHNGWLMFIGIPMDFRNTETIRGAVNTFGEFITGSIVMFRHVARLFTILFRLLVWSHEMWFFVNLMWVGTLVLVIPGWRHVLF